MFPAAAASPGPPPALWRALLLQAKASEKREPVVDAEVFLALLAQEYLYSSGVLPRPTAATVYPYGFLLSPPAAPVGTSPPPAPSPAGHAAEAVSASSQPAAAAAEVRRRPVATSGGGS